MGLLYLNEKLDPSWGENWDPEKVKNYKEALLHRISQLLIEKWSQIEPFVNGGGIEALQKTIRNQEIQIGIQNEDESIVIYQSDVESTYLSNTIINYIIQYFNFTPVDNIDLRIGESRNSTANTSGEVNNSNINLYLSNINDTNGREFNINSIASLW